jgi:hypothetical protein
LSGFISVCLNIDQYKISTDLPLSMKNQWIL